MQCVSFCHVFDKREILFAFLVGPNLHLTDLKFFFQRKKPSKSPPSFYVIHVWFCVVACVKSTLFHSQVLWFVGGTRYQWQWVKAAVGFFCHCWATPDVHAGLSHVVFTKWGWILPKTKLWMLFISCRAFSHQRDCKIKINYHVLLF